MRQVFCYDCKRLRVTRGAGMYDSPDYSCIMETKLEYKKDAIGEWNRRVTHIDDPMIKNSGNDCKDFIPKPPSMFYRFLSLFTRRAK
jgi:hypothetical protein